MVAVEAFTPAERAQAGRACAIFRVSAEMPAYFRAYLATWLEPLDAPLARRVRAMPDGELLALYDSLRGG
jgi:hypothetical protein